MIRKYITEFSVNRKIHITFLFIYLVVSQTAYAQISEFKISASDASTSSFFGKSVAISGDYAVVGAYIDNEQGNFAGKAYIFKRSGTSWIEEEILLPAEVTTFDEFGISVSISGDYAIVGARWDDDLGENSGTAYIYKRTDTTWTQHTQLLASDGGAGDLFGHSVSISGDYIIVGANGDSINADGAGSAYIFKLTDSIWTEEAKISASDGLSFDSFGYSVSIYGDYALIGAKSHDERGNGAGAAYMFMRSGTTWTLQAELLASDGTLFDYFGHSVSLSADHAVIGAIGEDEISSESGAAYVFKLIDSTWTEEVKLLASDGAFEDQFGSSVSISGDYFIVGAWEDDDSANASGSAYLFNLSDTGWVEVEKFNASDAAATDWFGESVSISDGYAFVGANGHSDFGGSSGSAYFYSGYFSHEPFVANQIMDIELDEDFGSIMVALLDTVFDDQNLPNDSLLYTVSVTSGLITATVAGDSLWLFSVADSNGMAEVVVTATDDSSLSVSDTFFVIVLPVNDAPFVENPIPDFEEDEDFGSIIVALLDTVFGDPDLPNDSLLYTVSVTSGLITASVSGDSLWLFSVTDLNGMAEIVVTVTDNSSISVSDSFNVTILPVGDDPSRFSLTFPLGDTLNTLQPTFSWHPAVDPDGGDVIEYQISISTSETMESPIYTESLSDTFHTINVQLTDDIKYYWSISANTTTVNPKLDYQTQIEPIFTNNCTSRGCHVSSNTGGGLNLQVGTSFGEITGASTTDNAPLVIAGNPDISPLIWKLEGEDNNGANVFGSRMPFGGPFLSNSTINSIRQWISEGANPFADDSSGGFSFSDTSYFLIDKQESPQAFSLISPADGSSIDTLRPLFRWEESVDPDPRDEVKYTLILRRATGPDSIVFKVFDIADTAYQVTEDFELGNYQWWVESHDADDTTFSLRSNEIYSLSVIVGIDDEFAGIPQEFELYQNYPNPFNPSTLIRYALPKFSNVSLVIYNLMGQEIMRWDESDVTPGYYEKTWNGKSQAGIPVSSGIYIYRINAGDFVLTRKMVLLK